MSTFFDVQPFSPSRRLLAVTRVPFIWRIPYPGDRAQVCVIDLANGTCTVVYETAGWGAQLGANVQWGADDDTLYCNDVIRGRGVGVQIDRTSLRTRPLAGPVFGLSPDHRFSFSPDLSLVNALIPGYGIPERIMRRARLTEPQSRTEGIWRTDLHTGDRTLFLSIHDLLADLPDQEELRSGISYVFNVKVNRQNTRLLVVLFTKGLGGTSRWATQLLTCDIDGRNVRLAVPYRLWRFGGHHPNWAPDGDHIVMNLRFRRTPMQFVRVRFDGADVTVLAPGHRGSGHPSLDPDSRLLLSDAYVTDGFTDSRGEVPIRIIDLERNVETALTRVYTNRLVGPRRVDPHPAWSADGSLICFNGVVDGMRQVLCADITDWHRETQ